jgi:hypothetical protein
MIIIANLRWSSVAVVVLWSTVRRLFHFTVDVVLFNILVLARICIKSGVCGCGSSALVRKRNTACSTRQDSVLPCRRWCRH